jgi:hypothetical protein
MGSSLVVACGEDPSNGQQGADGMAAPNPVTETQPSMMPGGSPMFGMSTMTDSPMLQKKPATGR